MTKASATSIGSVSKFAWLGISVITITMIVLFFHLSEMGKNVVIEVNPSLSFEYVGSQKLFLGMFFGFMTAMALSSFFIFTKSYKSLFAIYTAYIIFLLLFIATMHNVAVHYIWSSKIWLQASALPVYASLTLICVIIFTNKLLTLRTTLPTLYMLLQAMQLVFVLLLVGSFFISHALVLKAIVVMVALTAIVLTIVGVILFSKGDVIARYFCAAWFLLILAELSISLECLGLYEFPIARSYLLVIGTTVQALVLTLVMISTYIQNLQNAVNKSDDAQRKVRKAKKAQSLLIEQQEKAQLDLEYGIELRNLELDITLRELSDKNAELEKLTATDPLTGLMNRRYFDKRIIAESRRSKREMTCLGVAMLDIDHFKKINDNYGHLGGDYCLKEFAALLRKTVKRPSDTICRYGGEEFVLLLPNTNETGLAKLLEDIRKSVEEKQIVYEGKTISMTLSIGACSKVMASENEHEQVLAFADKQLYKAKESGRNRVIISQFG